MAKRRIRARLRKSGGALADRELKGASNVGRRTSNSGETLAGVSAHEFDSLGEDFEKKEDELFGDDGFEKVVAKVAEIEKKLRIYDLAQFTPKV